MKLSYVSNNNLSEKSIEELSEMLDNPNLNGISRTEINLALLDKLPKIDD